MGSGPPGKETVLTSYMWKVVRAGRSPPTSARPRRECRKQAIAIADAVTGNAARLVRGAHAVPMQGAGATADTDPPCTKARARLDRRRARVRSEEHTSELQSRQYLVCRLLLEKKKTDYIITSSN